MTDRYIRRVLQHKRRSGGTLDVGNLSPIEGPKDPMGMTRKALELRGHPRHIVEAMVRDVAAAQEAVKQAEKAAVAAMHAESCRVREELLKSMNRR